MSRKSLPLHEAAVYLDQVETLAALGDDTRQLPGAAGRARVLQRLMLRQRAMRLAAAFADLQR